jgi:hypothetical protein
MEKSNITKTLYSVTRHYSIMITYKSELYYYIVETNHWVSKPNAKEGIVRIARSKCYLDCGLRLKTSDRKNIKAQIEQLFNQENAPAIAHQIKGMSEASCDTIV